MCNCEFCHTNYRPRPQVKKPRACPECQKLRQRENEYRWRKGNPRYSYALYYVEWRKGRDRRLKAAADALSQCVRVGKEMLGMNVSMEELSVALAEFSSTLGIRRVNKLWNGNFAV